MLQEYLTTAGRRDSQSLSLEIIKEIFGQQKNSVIIWIGSEYFVTLTLISQINGRPLGRSKSNSGRYTLFKSSSNSKPSLKNITFCRIISTMSSKHYIIILVSLILTWCSHSLTGAKLLLLNITMSTALIATNNDKSADLFLYSRQIIFIFK